MQRWNKKLLKSNGLTEIKIKLKVEGKKFLKFLKSQMLSSYWLYDFLMNDGEIKSRIFLGMSETEKVDEYLFFRIVSIRFRRLSQHCSIPGRITNIDAERIIFSWFFLWRSVSRRRLKEMPRANGPWPIYFVNISKLSWMIYSFLCLKLRDSYLCASIKDYFANESEIDLEWSMIKKIGE